MKLLEKIFDNKESPVCLSYCDKIGFSVIAQETINKKTKEKISFEGMLQSFTQYKDGCFSLWKKSKKDMKVHFSQDGSNQIYRPLVGPISFLNHACRKHSNCCIKKAKGICLLHGDIRKYNANPRLNGKNINKSEELTLNYKMKKLKCRLCIEDARKSSKRRKRKLKLEEEEARKRRSKRHKRKLVVNRNRRMKQS